MMKGYLSEFVLGQLKREVHTMQKSTLIREWLVRSQPILGKDRKVQKYGVEAVCDEFKKQLVTSYVSVYQVDMSRCDE